MRKKILIIGAVLIIVLVASALFIGCFKMGVLPLPLTGKPHFDTFYNVTALANTSADERYPVWSPDGSKIFFKSDNWICVCNPDGSRREKLTEIEEPFVFSPDMKRVFYKKTISKEDKTIYQAYVMDINGKNREKIAELTLEEEYVDDGGYIGSTRGPMYDMHSWSPDRTKIFFTKLEETGYTWVWREKEGRWVRYEAGTEPSIPVVQWAGTEQKLIAKEHEKTAWIWDLKENELRFIGHLSYGIVHYTLKGEVVWSPDGKYVALPCIELSEAGATEQIFVVNVETGESKRLTSFIGANNWPDWSPDSMKIMYLREPPEYWWSPCIFDSDEGGDIWVVDIDGSNEKQLTDIPKNWEAGCWSPDGSKIAYISWEENHERIFDIWMMNADGSDKKLLVRNIIEWVAVLEWSPDVSKIAFDMWKIVKGELDHDIYVIDVPSGK